MQDSILTTVGIMLQSLGVTFVGMTIIYTLIKILVHYFPENH